MRGVKINAVRLYVAAEITEDVNGELAELAQIAADEVEASAAVSAAVGRRVVQQPLMRLPPPREIIRHRSLKLKPDRLAIPPPKQGRSRPRSGR